MLRNTMLQPMPSPKGTNKMGLYILQGKRANPTAAYDARGGLDQYAQHEGNGPNDQVGGLCAWIQENFEPGQIAELIKKLQDEGSDMTGDNDEPPAFPGAPRAGGGQVPMARTANDARNARLRQSDVEARNAQSFFARYPQAGRLRERF